MEKILKNNKMPKVGSYEASVVRRVQNRMTRKRLNNQRRRTNRRQAYRKGNKKRMMIRRAPFVETKSKTHEDVVVQFPGLTNRTNWSTYNTELVNMNPETFLMWKRGMEENEVIGNSCYAKYLKMKIGVRFPQPAFQTGAYGKLIPMFPQSYELIWGWVPNELGFTGGTTPTADTATINDIMNHINQRVRDYFDQQKDRLRFIPKAASTIRIVGRRKIRPDLRFSSTAPPQTTDATVGPDYAVGTIPDFRTSISWKMGKKLHLQPSSLLHATTEGLYPNFGTWLPFACIANWDYGLLPGEGGAATAAYCPAIQYNDCIWYSDS